MSHQPAEIFVSRGTTYIATCLNDSDLQDVFTRQVCMRLQQARLNGVNTIQDELGYPGWEISVTNNTYIVTVIIEEQLKQVFTHSVFMGLLKAESGPVRLQARLQKNQYPENLDEPPPPAPLSPSDNPSMPPKFSLEKESQEALEHCFKAQERFIQHPALLKSFLVSQTQLNQKACWVTKCKNGTYVPQLKSVEDLLRLVPATTGTSAAPTAAQQAPRPFVQWIKARELVPASQGLANPLPPSLSPLRATSPLAPREQPVPWNPWHV
jgi:hypothetical protein